MHRCMQILRSDADCPLSALVYEAATTRGLFTGYGVVGNVLYIKVSLRSVDSNDKEGEGKCIRYR